MKAITLLFCLSMLTVDAGAQKNSKRYPLVSFKELAVTPHDTVRLKAFVLNVYECPPCPPGMTCKPCMEDHFTVVEKKPVDIMKIPLDSRIRIFARQTDVKTGKQYTFIIAFRNRKAGTLDNLELISSARH